MSAKKILFIGNSYTFYGNLPEMIRQMAEYVGVKLEVSSVTSGGKSLEWHCYNIETIQALQREKWDYVALQEFSTRPLEEPDRMYASAEALFNKVTSKKARAVLYLTWARKFLPETQPDISRAYLELARRTSALIFPAGPAWQIVMAKNPEIELYDPDLTHPSVLGTYLTACVFCSSILGLNPEKVTNKIRLLHGATLVIEPEVAAILQKSARKTAREFKEYTK